MHKPDNIDIKLLNMVQANFPISPAPFLEMAERLGLREEEVLARLTNLKESGLIRRIGAVLDSRKLGFYSTLCAGRISEEKLAAATILINAEKGVTHNYIRDNERNVWFTLTTPSQEVAEQTIRNLEKKLDLPINNMPAEKVYKIKVSFEMRERDGL